MRYVMAALGGVFGFIVGGFFGILGGFAMFGNTPGGGNSLSATAFVIALLGAACGAAVGYFSGGD